MSWPTTEELLKEVERCETALLNAKRTLDYYAELEKMLKFAKLMNRTLFRVDGKWVLSDCHTITQRMINRDVPPTESNS